MGDLATALSAWTQAQTPALTAQVYAALVDGELLLPVRARVVSEQVAAGTGLHAEREAELDIITVDLPGRRRVLPAFTSAELMRRWRLDARPVRSTVCDACRAVLDEGWAGLLLDPSSHDFVLNPAAVRALANGFVPVAGDESVSVGTLAGAGLVPGDGAAASAHVLAALRRAVARETTVGEAFLLRTEPGLEVGVVLRVPLDAAGLATVAARLAGRLAAAGVAGADRLLVAALDPATAAQAAARSTRLWP